MNNIEGILNRWSARHGGMGKAKRLIRLLYAEVKKQNSRITILEEAMWQPDSEPETPTSLTDAELTGDTLRIDTNEAMGMTEVPTKDASTDDPNYNEQRDLAIEPEPEPNSDLDDLIADLTKEPNNEDPAGELEE